MDIEIINRAKIYVKELFAKDFSGHDYWHTIRVFNMAIKLAEEENADIFIVGLASLLHDADDIKLSPYTNKYKLNAYNFMKSCKLEDDVISKIIKIISEISYSSNHKIPTTIESMCVQDADRLEAIGAIGIARAFAFGGNKNRLIYDPDIKPNLNMSEEEYRQSKSTSINHFYEKLLKLKDLMNTKTGKKLAKQRHEFMKNYLEEFMLEWNSEK